MKLITIRRVLLTGLLLTAAALLQPAVAQSEVSEASGQIVDKDGNPVKGAQITFWPKSNPHLKYTGKTNKKGRYFVVGLYTPQEGDRWMTEVAAEGLLPIEMVVESRTVNKVLIGDIMTQKLKAGSKISEFPIPRMGFAKVDFTMAPEDEVPRVGSAAASADDMMDMKPVAASGSGDGGGKGADTRVDAWTQATTLAAAHEFEASLPHFVKAIDDEPDDVERAETYAKVLYQVGRYDEARDVTVALLEKQPERFEAHMLLGTIYLKSGDMEGALATLAAARELAPQDVAVHQQIAYAASQLGREEVQLEAYDAITEIQPDNAEAWLALGNLHHKRGDEATSETCYQKVVDLDPKNAYQTYFNLGSLIMNRSNRSDDDTRRAIDAFRRATEIKNDYAPAFKQLAFALLGVGDRPGAKKAFQDFLKVKPKGAEADQVRSLLNTL